MARNTNPGTNARASTSGLTAIDFGSALSFNECVDLIASCPEIRVHVEGEPGIGKSTVLKMLQNEMGDKYDCIYVDCPVMDVSDVVMRIPDHATKTLPSYVSELFKLDSPKPKIMMVAGIPLASATHLKSRSVLLFLANT